MNILTWFSSRSARRLRRADHRRTEGWWLWAGLLLAAALGCGGGSATQGVTVDPAPAPAPIDTAAARVFDLAQDTVLGPLVADWPRAEAEGDRALSRASDSATEPDEMVYRVQLYTTKDLGTAQSVSKKAAVDFGQQVQIDYETPYYKVRVGTFASPQAAEPLLEEARRRGFTGAWAVRVRASEQAP